MCINPTEKLWAVNVEIWTFVSFQLYFFWSVYSFFFTLSWPLAKQFLIVLLKPNIHYAPGILTRIKNKLTKKPHKWNHLFSLCRLWGLFWKNKQIHINHSKSLSVISYLSSVYYYHELFRTLRNNLILPLANTANKVVNRTTFAIKPGV